MEAAAEGVPVRWGRTCSSGEAEEDHQGARQGEQIGVGDLSDVLAELGSGHGGELVDHDAARVGQALAGPDVQLDAQQWDLGGVTGQWADGDRVGGVESVVLHDENRPRLAGVVLTASGRPELASPHSCSLSSLSSPNHEMASTNA